jgi:hypothetical protein
MALARRRESDAALVALLSPQLGRQPAPDRSQC